MNRLSRDADSTHLEPLAMDVLVHLLAHHDRVVSADEVLDQVWSPLRGDPGMVKKRIGQIRRALGDDARQPIYIETIPKRGYRAIARVSRVGERLENEALGLSTPVGSLESANGSGEAMEEPAARTEAIIEANPPHDRSRRALGLLLLVVAVAIASFYWWISTPVEVSAPERLRLSVEPFASPSGDYGLEGYAKLLENEVTYQLMRVAQPSMDLVQSTAEADFVVRGSMTGLPDGARLFIQVIVTDSGTVMWSKGLDLPSEPSEELIDTRPEHLATMIYQVASISTFASRLTESSQAVRELIAGVLETSEMWQGLGGDWNAALVHLEKASELDPEFILAPVFLANLYVNRMGRTLRYEEAAPAAHDYTKRVLELDETWTWLAGWVATHDLDYEAAAANYDYARRAGHPARYMEFDLGLLALIQGHPEEAIPRFNTTLEMGALENQAMSHVLIAHAYLLMGKYAAARKAAETAVVETAGTGAYAHLLALEIKTYAECHDGDIAAARRTLEPAWEAYGDTHPQAFAGLFALVGDQEAAREILRDSEKRWAEGEAGLLSAYFWGYYHLGDLDRAFVWLRRAIEDREVGFVAFLHRSPALDPIRDDPRFKAAMSRLTEIEQAGTPIRTVVYP